MKITLVVLALFTAFMLFNARPFNYENSSTYPDSLKQNLNPKANSKLKDDNKMQIVKSDEEWKKVLTPMQYDVLRKKGTERPFTGEYWDNFEKGVYKCAGCGEVLFKSNTKFDAGCGWPSFYDAIDKSKIIEIDDYSHGMHRIEVICKKCGGHLGHVFPDGPKPTGLRYCINSASLIFEKGK